MTSVQYQKVTQSINYLVRKAPESNLNKLKLIKLLWAADRYHLRKYGRFVSDDNYVAMDKGPVASLALHIINDDTDFTSKTSINYGRKYIKLHGYDVRSLRETDDSFLSGSDKEALNFAWDAFGHMDRFKLVEVAHTYPEWEKHENTLQSMKTSIPMNVLDFFDNPEGLRDDPFHMDSELLEANKKTLKQKKALDHLFV